MTATPEQREASILDTVAHIRRVQSLLGDVVKNIMDRMLSHDASKLSDPELTAYADCTYKLKDLTYGSDEYRQCLAEMKPAIEHHYRRNSHHPEHRTGGVCDMSLIDLLEMLVDWKAAGERHADGSIEKSLAINRERFRIGDQLQAILSRTSLELWPGGFLEPWHCCGCGLLGCVGNFCEQCGAGKNDYQAAK